MFYLLFLFWIGFYEFVIYFLCLCVFVFKKVKVDFSLGLWNIFGSMGFDSFGMNGEKWWWYGCVAEFVDFVGIVCALSFDGIDEENDDCWQEEQDEENDEVMLCLLTVDGGGGGSPLSMVMTTWNQWYFFLIISFENSGMTHLLCWIWLLY